MLLHARRVGHIPQPRLVVRHQCDCAQSPVLPEAFVVAEEKELVVANGPAERAAELVALEFGNRSSVEVVPGIERTVTDEFERRAVRLVGSGRGDDADLCAVAFAKGRAVSVSGHVELAHSIHTQQVRRWCRPALH